MVVELAKVVERVRSCHACKFSVCACVCVCVCARACVSLCLRVSVCDASLEYLRGDGNHQGQRYKHMRFAGAQTRIYTHAHTLAVLTAQGDQLYMHLSAVSRILTYVTQDVSCI